ncbi:piggyBac transposable element-derived protein 4 [Trichonephila clavata]|uniref:PiggyBac transposable element-derived protein 4 n=1 Tax=Trichonephila clavata TaxID=2740835 RepID=A0A8X6F2M3_TRICU|nr:piggyBac transposable element-derived protein 4 [Trichonephila clavata]
MWSYFYTNPFWCLTLSYLTGHIRPKQISKNSLGTEKLLRLIGDFSTSPANIFEEELDDESIDLDDEIDDSDFKDPTHNLQYLSNSYECEMDIDHDTIPQNTKNSDALSETDTASLSSVDEMHQLMLRAAGQSYGFMQIQHSSLE